MKRRQQFDADDPAEGIIGGHQQGSAFAGAEVDESEVVEVEAGLGREEGHHFVEQSRFGRLIGRVKNSEETVAPADGGAGGVDAEIPVVVDIAITLAAAWGVESRRNSATSFKSWVEAER